MVRGRFLKEARQKEDGHLKAADGHPLPSVNTERFQEESKQRQRTGHGLMGRT